MAIETVNQPIMQASAATPEKLQGTIKDMDALAQDGFSEISAIAKLALAYMERPDSYNHRENIAHALTSIWGKADDTLNNISHEAEKVGCNFVDEAQNRRYAANRAAREAA